MAWVAVSCINIEYVFDSKPIRMMCATGGGIWKNKSDYNKIILPKGSIKKLIGRELKWEDSPVELKE